MPIDTEKQTLIKAALHCAAEKGWARTTLRDIAAAADVKLHVLCAHFDDKNDILAAYSRMIDARLLEELGDIVDNSLPPRDRLFDIMMERYDLLNEQREGLIAVLRSYKCDPKQALFGLPAVGKSMCWMLEAAGLDTSGLGGAAKIIGLGAVHADTLRTWMKDDSPDMAKTMAALDKNLERAEHWAGRVLRG